MPVTICRFGAVALYLGRGTGISTARSARLVHDDLVQCRQRRLEGIPDPDRQHFAGRVFQPGDLVEAAMIQLLEDWRERGFDLGEIHDPARIGSRFAAHMHFDPKRMTVHARAFVAGWHARQPMRGFELKDLENIHGLS